MKRNKWLLILSLILVVSMLVVGCGPKQETTEPAKSDAETTEAAGEATEAEKTEEAAETEEAAAPADGSHPALAEGKVDGVLDVCIASEPETIDPALNTSVDGAMMLQHSNEGLVKWVDDGAGNATLAPGQAESWEISEDGMTYTFKIREDAKWSDGQPVTANDFVFSWNRLVDPATAADYEYMLDMVAGYADKALQIEAPDDHTFVVTLDRFCPFFEEICAFASTFPVREDIVTGNEQWATSPDTYISNGPYKMTAWEHNSAITYEKNEEYYDAANIKAPVLKFHLKDDNNAIYAAFLSGELDFIDDAPQEERKPLIEAGALQVKPYIGTYFVCFNTQEAPFDDARVRKAFSLVIDRNFIVDQVAAQGQLPASGFVPAEVSDVAGLEGDDFRTVGGDYYSVNAADYQAQCDEARALLEEAGFPNGEGFPMVEYLYNTNDGHKAIGEALQNMWLTELGIDVTLQNQDWAVFLTERKEGNFSIARHGWIADYNDPMTFIDMWVTGGGNNDAQYENADFDALVEQAKDAKNLEDRMKFMHEAEDVMMGQDHIVAPIYYYNNAFMIKPNIQGMYYTPLGYYFFGGTTGF